jgi:putative hemolysin
MTSTEIVLLALLLVASTLVAASETLLLTLGHDAAGTLGVVRKLRRSLAGRLFGSDTALTGLQVVELAIHFSLALIMARSMAGAHDPASVALGVLGVALTSLALAELARGRIFAALTRDDEGLTDDRAPVRLRALASIAVALQPFGRLIDGCVDGIATVFSRRRARKPAMSTREVNQIVAEATRQGALLHGENRVLLNLVAFGTEPVKTYMTPRPDMDVLDTEWPADHILQTVRRTRHRRFPVIEGSLDRVLGCIVAKEYCLDAKRGLDAHLRPLPYIPESKVAGDVFQEMRAAGNHMALVVDEYGSIEGMVTLNGLVSGLMGGIPDEFTGNPSRVLHLGEGRYIVDGALSVEELNLELDLALPLRPNTTVAGLVFSLLGHLPRPGESVDAHGVSFTVLSLRRNRIVSIELRKP